MKVVLASKNEGKIKEFNMILTKFNIELLSLKDINFTDEIVETGNTFFENALIKAKTIYDIVKIPVIADDSGICVKYLDGAPGIYSARYGGLKTDYERNMLLLKNMEGVLDREAYFHCSLVFYLGEDNYHHFPGEIHGKLANSVIGGGGFGYDVIFIPNGFDSTFGMISSEIKNEISHRAVSIKSFVKFLENDFNN